MAYPIYRYRQDSAGIDVPVRNRRGLQPLDRVLLRAAECEHPADLGDARAFVLATNRRYWPAISTRFGGDAWDVAVELARRGVVAVACRVDGNMRLGTPLGWELTETWQRHRSAVATERAQELDEFRARARSLMTQLDQWPDLDTALRAALPRRDVVRLELLINAASDLREGVRHPGPRAFSQVHYGHTKARADGAALLRTYGVAEETLIALGLERAKYIGLSGLDVAVRERHVCLSAIRGPVLLQCDEPGLCIVASPSRPPLVVVENLQAAEATTRAEMGVAVAYTSGVMSLPGLELLKQAAAAAERVAVIPDADLGGVRIAEQVLSVVPTAEVLDIGEYPHPERRRFPADGVSIRGLQQSLRGPARFLARSVLERGYPVEQEMATVEAVTAWLSRVVGQAHQVDAVSSF